MPPMKVWVGNIPYDTFRLHFAESLRVRGFNDTIDVVVFNNRNGYDAYGFVTMPSKLRGTQLMECCDGTFFAELGVSITLEPLIFRPAKRESSEHINLCTYMHVYKYWN